MPGVERRGRELYIVEGGFSKEAAEVAGADGEDELVGSAEGDVCERLLVAQGLEDLDRGGGGEDGALSRDLLNAYLLCFGCEKREEGHGTYLSKILYLRLKAFKKL